MVLRLFDVKIAKCLVKGRHVAGKKGILHAGGERLKDFLRVQAARAHARVFAFLNGLFACCFFRFPQSHFCSFLNSSNETLQFNIEPVHIILICLLHLCVKLGHCSNRWHFRGFRQLKQELQ
mmetsp:Transcript_84278/g.261806  ORF Transcript_84278/g.261806 Transcript_84278/m.261806 type:complete len:122 (-) Transcript_84278:94-459(-)